MVNEAGDKPGVAALTELRAELAEEARAVAKDASAAESAGQHGRAAAFQRALTAINKRLQAVDQQLAEASAQGGQGGKPAPSRPAPPPEPVEAPLGTWELLLFGSTTIAFFVALVLGFLLTQSRANLEALLGPRAAQRLLASPLAAFAMRVPALKAMAEAANVPQQEL